MLFMINDKQKFIFIDMTDVAHENEKWLSEITNNFF